MNLTPEQMANGRRNFLKTIAGVPAVAASPVITLAPRMPSAGRPVRGSITWP